MFCIQILFLPSWKWRMGPYEISFLYRVIFHLNDYAYYGRKGIPDQIQTFLCLRLKGSGKNTTNDVVFFFFFLMRLLRRSNISSGFPTGKRKVAGILMVDLVSSFLEPMRLFHAFPGPFAPEFFSTFNLQNRSKIT